MTQEWVHTAQSTANKASKKAAASKDEAQQEKEQSAGIIQQYFPNVALLHKDYALIRSLIYNENFMFVEQIAEQVMNMTWGSIDSVKNTLGINETTHERK
ncbi:hypothetical protein C3L33_09611, partial [Rhododendron williamsianum]